MTPKEKADQLIKEFYPEVQWKLGQEDCLDRAKRCVLITVDEIDKSQPYHLYNNEDKKQYWLAVKQETENYDAKRKSRTVS